MAQQSVARVPPAVLATDAHASMPSGHVIKYPKEDFHVSKPYWWLESRFHFAYAEWTAGRKNFGKLGLLNDDLVQSNAGFPRHPHNNAEIFSYIVDGYLTHEDSMGNKESLGRGSVQYLSAGTGIFHSEMNEHDKTCRFLQAWLFPDKEGHVPQYGSSTYDPEERHNKLLVLLGGTDRVPDWPNVQEGRGITINQDATIFVSENDPGMKHSLVFGPGRQGYLVCIEGGLELAGSAAASCRLGPRDGAEIVAGGAEELRLSLTAGEQGAHFMLIELASP